MTITQQIFAFLDSKPYTLDGVHGRFSLEGSSLYHRPTNRRSETYRKIKAQLGDDWDTDLTASERIVPIAIELGFK